MALKRIPVILHRKPFNFDGVNVLSVLDTSLSKVQSPIPFLEKDVEETEVPQEPDMETLPDFIHRFKRPDGHYVDFLIKANRIETVVHHGPVVPSKTASKRLRRPKGSTEGAVWEMIRAQLERLPKPPDKALPLKRWREALLVFDVPKRKAAAFSAQSSESLVWEFTELVLQSPYGMMTDWKAVVIDHEQLIPILARLGVPASFEERRKDYRITLSLGEQETSFVRPWSWNDQDFQGQVFDLERILTKTISIYSLVEYEKTDTYGHAFLTAERWAHAQHLLGDWFGCTFRKHRANRQFKPEKLKPSKVLKKGPKRHHKEA
jgi:hypothetical protein